MSKYCRSLGVIHVVDEEYLQGWESVIDEADAEA